MPRNPWLAALLSLLTPGLGQVYNGRMAKGLLLHGTLLAASAAAGLWMLLVPGAIPGVLAPLALLLLVWGCILADAVRDARRTGRSFRPRAYNRWYVYAALVLLSGFVVDPVRAAAFRRFIYESFRITGASMAPTLLPGDFVMVATRGFDAGALSRGDLIVFPGPHEPGRKLVSRVVGIAGDTLRMENKRLYVNGVTPEEPYIQHVDAGRDVFVPAMLWQRGHVAAGVDTAGYRPTRDDWGPLIVPHGHVFVLGDNRDDALDSRDYGFIPAESVVGRPKRLYLSWDAEARRIRWERIGQDIR
jgi:signal peptidase I